MMRLLAAAACTGAALWWLLRGPWQVQARRELDAVGFGPSSVHVSAWGLAGCLGVCAGIIAFSRGGADIALLVSVPLTMWTGALLPRVLETWVVSSYRVRRDQAALEALRRMRLLVAGGVALRVAAQRAAQDQTDPAFGPIAAEVDEAVRELKNPLTAIGSHLSSGPASTLLGAAESSQEGGSEAGRHLDHLLGRAVAALEGERRVKVDRLGRSAANTATITTMLAMMPLMLSLLTALSF